MTIFGAAKVAIFGAAKVAIFGAAKVAMPGAARVAALKLAVLVAGLALEGAGLGCPGRRLCLCAQIRS